jgi:uncharacterized protein (DUF427 family)
MKATIDGVVIAQSDATVVVEGNHYFPLESVRADTLKPSRMKSLCPWKGVASYYHVEVAGASAHNSAWTYRHPYPWIRKIRDRVAFWGAVQVTRD